MGGSVDIPWGEPLLEHRELPKGLAEHCKRALGVVPSCLKHLSSQPWVVEHVADLMSYSPEHIEEDWADAVPLVVSQENGCRYCYGSTRAFLRIRGWSEQRIERIERAIDLEDEPVIAGIVRFVRTLARSNPRPAGPEREELLRLGLSPVQIAELAMLIADSAMLNRVATFVAVPAEKGLEALGQSWWAKPVRPIMRAVMKRMGTASDYSDQPSWDGPYRPLVELLDGIRAASTFSHGLRLCFESGTLSRRTKLLTFGIVARALDCERCNDEACRGLIEDGLDAKAVERALDTLDSPDIPESERAVLPWVRETVWYVPLDVQTRTRELHDKLGSAATLDAIGTAAFANAAVRLAMLGA